MKNMDNRSDIIKLQDKLTGVLIGLVRATEGNERMLSEETDRIILEGLVAGNHIAALNEEVIAGLIQRAEDERKRLIPNCYYCASPCGRTNNYDMHNLWISDEESRSLRTALLYSIRGIAEYALVAYMSGHTDRSVIEFFYRALYVVGMDEWGVEELRSIINEVGGISLKCRILYNRTQSEVQRCDPVISISQ